jgi:hypothetical protein
LIRLEIDAETKALIEGAAVLAVYYAEAFSPIGGSKIFIVDAQETVTGPDGQFKIPSKSGRADNYQGKLEGSLLIFKSEYGVFPNHKLSKAAIEFKAWPPPEKYIVYELPKLKTRDEREDHVTYIDICYAIPYSKKNIIGWLLMKNVKVLDYHKTL